MIPLTLTLGSLNGHAVNKHVVATPASWPLLRCSDSEGWGPLTLSGDNITPCFSSSLTLAVSMFGLAAGVPTLWWLAETTSIESRRQIGWQYWTKMVAVQIVGRPRQWLLELRVWASAALSASLLIVFYVQYLQRARLQRGRPFVTTYWTLLLLAFGTELYSALTRRVYRVDVPSFTFVCIRFGLVSTVVLLAWTISDQTAGQPLEGSEMECPGGRATILSTLTFSWMTPLMRRGYKQHITEDDLWDLASCDTTRTAAQTFQDAWTHEQASRKKRPSLWFALFRGFGTAYAQGILFKAAADVLAILQPHLLRFFILFVDSYRGRRPQPFTLGAALALSMFVVSVAQSLCLHQCFQRLSHVGIKLKSSLVSAIYRKSLRLSNEARGTKSTGDIVNLMAVDSQRVQDVTQFSQHLWSAPLQVALCMQSLYGLLGYSMFAGVVLMIVTIPANGYVTGSMKVLQKQQMKNKDARSKLIAEVVANIKSIKLFAWGSAFADRIRHVRNDKELVTLRKTGALQTVSSFIGSATPFLVACSAFAVRVLVQRKPLTTDIVFPAIGLFKLLASPLTILPAAISSITEASVAVGRLKAFFTADELQSDAVMREDAVHASDEESQPWVLNATVRDNITFGKPWDPDFYAETVKACALLDDLAQLPDGDQTEVGDKGITLSGGQKARLTLARAVYARADIYLLDDCLSAVDQHVGRHLIDEVFGRRGCLKDATRILATNSTPVLSEANSIFVIRDGNIAAQGTHDELRAHGQDVASLIGHPNPPTQVTADSTVGKSAFPDNDNSNGRQLPGDDETSRGSGSRTQGQDVASESRACVHGTERTGRDFPDAEAAAGKHKRSKELTQKGSVTWQVYGDYAKASSLAAVSVYTVSLIGAQAAEIGGNVWLKQWSEANEDPKAEVDAVTYLGIYLAFGLGSAGLVVLQSSTLWLWCSIEPLSDIYRIDQSLPRQFNTLFVNSIKAVFSLAVISAGMPVFVILAIPLAIVYGYMQRYYLGAKRELKRLDGTSRSPVFAHFQESLGGLTTIRAYSQQERFSLESERRLDANMKAYLPSITANRWLGVRLEFIGSIIIFSTAGLALARLSLGSLRLVDYSMRYQPELPLVLRNLNLNFNPGEKIGVVGRTGAGKSSLAMALFRIIEPQNGSIRVDDVDISQIGLCDLRRRLTIIPQDPALFEGTIRENLDPQQQHDDTELWTALGSNLSQGQKQLISLARAILKPSSILVLDEATAAVDTETDSRLQETLRDGIFDGRTVITIAHRLNTIVDSDRIVVLEQGRVVEFDSPAVLMRQKGAFYQLVNEAGLSETLEVATAHDVK
ncbi:LOW QUALITY PROTEIN: multidrug resistance-associated protein 1 [Purpureocillium lavendulum]|uniref:Multidrug resistance-associated protein 1 n=1 Tax=Purpureocillium lavendulum TaxID=1247861 RepID=A0AB34FKE8_9HYPO|nr:LOW QUALITY PROTEIN: multidrug resistance-associated protein 1 [Purpureocillium lavendulum]